LAIVLLFPFLSAKFGVDPLFVYGCNIVRYNLLPFQISRY